MNDLELELLVWRIFGILFPFAFVALVVLIVRAMFRKPEDKFRRVYAGIEIFTEPVRGSVFMRFHTYDGFLLWATQHEHAFYALPDQARELLRRLHRYNLTRGILAYGALFIPFISHFNYKAQLRSITAQEIEEAFAEPGSADGVDGLPSVAAAAAARGRERSWFHHFFGWTAAVLSVFFVVVSAACLVQREWEAAIGVVVFSLLLGVVARDWARRAPS